MRQDNTSHVKVSAETFARRLAASPFFKRGYEDYTKGRPYDYSIVDKVEAIHYARGRAFAIYSHQQRTPRAVWRKGTLARTAQERLVMAAYTGYVL
jgi:hypothetical protein